jgi:monoamine oxidase
VLVLEARDRIGGCVWTHREPGLAVPVELGAEFIHGRPQATFSLMRKAGVRGVVAPIGRMIVRDGKLRARRGDVFPVVQRVLRRHIPGLARRDVSFATLLGRMRDELPGEALTFARMRVKGYDAAEPERVSALAIATAWAGESADGSGHLRPRGGYGPLLASLADGSGSNVRIRLQAVVRSVRWKRGAVEIEGARRDNPFRVRARCAIVTLPLGVLQQRSNARGAVLFAPALREKAQPLAHLASGPVMKAVLRFRSAFWEELDDAAYRGASFFHSPRAAFPTFWTALPAHAPLITAWAGGPKAARLTGASRSHIVGCAVRSLTSIFGRRVNIEDELVAAWCHDWQQDPYARGAYSHVLVGGSGMRRVLAAPLADTLFFAGEATDWSGEHSTVAGALRSGVRAAREVLDAFKG